MILLERSQLEEWLNTLLEWALLRDLYAAVFIRPYSRFSGAMLCHIMGHSREGGAMITQILSVLIMVLAAGGVIGCGGGSGIVQISNDTYMHSKLGGAFTVSGSEVKAELYKEANEFCSVKGKKMEPLTSSHIDNMGANYASAEIQFKCL